MKRQKTCGPHLGKLVHQLPVIVTFAYDIHFRRMIDHWKGIVEEIHFGGNIEVTCIFLTILPKNLRLGPQNDSGSEKLLKNSKLPKLLENCFEPVGKGGWPPIST
jgi:hypothetical protein